ncbi:MAG: hypothetical protein RBR93_12655 [Aliarcobacter butzleri]|nr:hypothetical protein [Aliarcobacter butzleri]
MKLLEAIKNRKPLKIQLDTDFVLDFNWNGELYESRCGYITIEKIIDIANGKHDYKILDILEEK